MSITQLLSPTNLGYQNLDVVIFHIKPPILPYCVNYVYVEREKCTKMYSKSNVQCSQ